ncbi:MAG TPA: hypothetical protein VJ914_40270 [Pseudonocardiaceae bacterium]|nr:hypothetical protein [Pseudonocardiaceae bacterium]
MANLQELISLRKGDRSYEQLSRACGGNPGAPRLHQLATNEIKGFPDPPTIRGLAKGLGVTEMTVVLATAESLGLDIQMPGGDGWAALLPAGTDRLPSHFRDAVLAVVHSAIQVVEEAKPAERDVEGTSSSGDASVTALRPAEDARLVTRAARKRPTTPSE